jgi:hypothetical protein
VNLHFLESFRAIRLGPGIVSKNLWALIAILSLLAVALFTTHDEKMRLMFVLIGAGLFGLYYLSNLIMMRARPEIALLEGAELVAFYQSHQGMMGRSEVADAPGVEKPDAPPRLPAGGNLG